MKSMTSEKFDEVFEYLKKCNGIMDIVSLVSVDILLSDGYDLTDYQREVILDHQSKFVQDSKKFMEWFAIDEILTNQFHKDDPYLTFIDVKYVHEKCLCDPFTFWNNKSTDRLELSADIGNTFEKSKLNIKLFGNLSLLNSKYITDEYKKSYNDMLDIFEKIVAHKQIKLFDQIVGIVKFPINK